MIRIRTPSRLHFGLFSLPCAYSSTWLNQEGQATLPRRQFGGVGLMIDQPGIELTVACSNHWLAEGELADRALRLAQRYCTSAGVQSPFHLRMISAAPEHAGLGTGTQLGLAVAYAIAHLTGQSLNAEVLARHVGRGLRSALGVHGFAHGGLLVEGGKLTEAAISPLLARHDFPAEWSILLFLLPSLQGAHGQNERAAFAELMEQTRDDPSTESLCRLVLLNLLPALVERDLITFGEALYDFNRRVGTLFHAIQHGCYAHPRIEQLVKTLRDAGIKGVGQSSWGPAVFAIVPAEQVTELCAWLSRTQDEIIVAQASNQGPACGFAS
jgi:beta-ribofuranosylaminobenzene 5'-phosphate synthase